MTPLTAPCRPAFALSKSRSSRTSVRNPAIHSGATFRGPLDRPRVRWVRTRFTLRSATASTTARSALASVDTVPRVVLCGNLLITSGSSSPGEDGSCSGRIGSRSMVAGPADPIVAELEQQRPQVPGERQMRAVPVGRTTIRQPVSQELVVQRRTTRLSVSTSLRRIGSIPTRWWASSTGSSRVRCRSPGWRADIDSQHADEDYARHETSHRWA